MFAIKNICLFIILILFFTSSYSQETNNKNSYTFNIQCYGIPMENMDLPLGVIFNLGYDIIPNKKQHVFSIEPRIGGGVFGNKVNDGIPETQLYQYSIGCLYAGIAPKVYLDLNLNSDNKVFLYLENEFSFLNTFAKIEDYHISTARNVNDFLHFYYSCKLGLSYPLFKKKESTIWAGYTTLDFSNMLNKNIPRDRHHFGGEYLGFCFGMGFYF
ncbi:hypothetical protein [uncultured Bacteroides sp.]|uniref:hypothetical protein n=1 Tax=uncultured Bacteroides sp. TaxID=162156 RepID=UPI002AAC2B9D|nr:hypothetical protein [uncultured Bacteroides sp.]